MKEERELEWKREVEAFNARKKEMEEWRERDRQWRNRAKVEQLALFEKRQVEFSVPVSYPLGTIYFLIIDYTEVQIVIGCNRKGPLSWSRLPD